MKDILKLRSIDYPNIWFISDTHYGHKNITYGESTWANKETGCRRFNTTQEMSSHIVNQINKYVGKDDLLIHLGDWSFGGVNNIWNFRKQIICQNIILLVGNHDASIRNNIILPNVRRDSPYSFHFVDCAPINNTDPEYPDYVQAQDLFLIVEDYLEIMIDNDLFCCMHYPLQEWNDRHHKSYMLHGHQHGNNVYKKNRLDVGIDNVLNIFGELRPISNKEVIQIIKQQNNESNCNWRCSWLD